MNNKRIVKRILLFSLIFVFMTALTLPCSLAADTDFEASISAFPESYKPALRNLHEKHPEWTFTPLITGLDWSSAVNGEHQDNLSLVINDSAYTDIFKSREAGDFNFSTGRYIEKDYGFARANKLAISYYMDPRNFLSEEGIFQFEDYSFSNLITVESVEHVLKGSFMENKVISYLDKNGNTVKTNEKYSQVIFEAGKLYNANPCFLASKIIHEVGSNGSGSVSGKYGSYPGIYNFYNIGANDNPSGAIAGGLKWASSGTTYQRPWTTPKKSIQGGAQYIAEKYISKGQQTGYLQRFNVNPKAEFDTFTHQYMTNLSGAAIPAYLNYQAYKNSGMLDFEFRFLIPVYKNMTGETNTSGSVKAADSYNQQGTFSTASNTYNIRKGPSTSNDKYPFTVSSGTAVKILDSVFTDSVYYDNIMRYPYWRKISFSSGSTSYTGYVYSNFIKLSTYTVVPTGTYKPVEFKNNPELSLKYISSDPSVATIVSDKTIKFLKAGTVEITAYDSLGNYQVIQYKVVDNASDYSVKNVRISKNSIGNISVSFDKNAKYNYYEVFLTDSDNKPIKATTVTGNSAVFTGINLNQTVKAYVRGLYKNGNTKMYSVFANPVTIVNEPTPPDVPKGLKAVQNGYHSVKVAWTPVTGAAGYEVFTCDSNGNRKLLGSVSGSESVYLDKSRSLIDGATYCIRAYVNSSSGAKIYSDYSQPVTFAPVKITVKAVSGLKQKQTTPNGYTLYWSEVSDVDGYEIYRYNTSKKIYEKIASPTKPEYAISGLTPSSMARYKVRAVVKAFSSTYYSAFSALLDAESAPNTVAKISQASTTATSYKLQWSAVKNADGYRIYRYDSAKKAYIKLADTSNTSYTVSSLKASQKNLYKVKAYAKTTSGAVFGNAISYTASTCPAAVSSFKQKSTTASSYILYWSKVTNASGYRIYKYDSKKKTYVKLADTSNTYYKVASLKAGQTVKYMVHAYTKTPSGSVFGNTVSYTASTCPAAVSSLRQKSTSTSTYTLYWSKVSNASGYRIYKYDSKKKTYVRLADTRNTYYKISSLKAGQTAKYKVCAYTKTLSGAVFGNTAAYTASTCPAAVTAIWQQAITTSGYTLKWNKSANATGYRVYRYDSKQKKYIVLKNTSANSIKITGKKSGQTDTYKIKAYTKTASGYVYSATSPAFKVKTK